MWNGFFHASCSSLSVVFHKDKKTFAELGVLLTLANYRSLSSSFLLSRLSFT